MRWQSAFPAAERAATAPDHRRRSFVKGFWQALFGNISATS